MAVYINPLRTLQVEISEIMCKTIGDSAVVAILLAYFAVHQSLCTNVNHEELVFYEGMSDI